MRCVLLSALVGVVWAAAGVPARAEDPLVEKVRQAIHDGKNFLLGQQRGGNGSWETDAAHVAYPGGATSLAMLALLTAGMSPEDRAIQDGLKYLRDIRPGRFSKTYVVGLQTMVYAQAGQAVDRERIAKNVEWLLAHQKPAGWGYGDDAGADNSNTQYAVLGLHAAVEAGIPVPKEALERLRRQMIDTQIPRAMAGRAGAGGWPYKLGNPASMTMTCAGLCNLTITGMDLDVGKQRMEGGVIKDCGVYDENAPAADALRWIGGRFPADLNAANALTQLGPAQFYCLYGIERTGRLTGQRFFGGHDWYEIGCRHLVAIQKGDGSWQGLGNLDGSPVIATSFALLFLAKGRTPVLISKLAFGPRDYAGWNNKHSDARHLVEFASRELFKRQPLAWQIFDARGLAETQAQRRRLAAELLPSPIIYFNGHDYAPRGNEEEVLKEYLENGGFLLAEACCGSETFRRDFEKLMGRIFPDSELKPLPDDHPIWTASGKFLVTPNRPFPLYGVQHGCKWVAVFSPKPMAYYWEANDFDKSPEGRAAFQLAANIIAYATGLEPPRPRLTEVDIPRDDSKERVRRGYLKVGQLRYTPAGGDWRPAPKAMRNLMNEVRKVGLDVVLEPTPVYPSVEKVVRYRFLYMHGRGAFEERAKDLKHLHFNLTSGGLLLADACCGSPAFDASFRKFIETLFAEEKLKLEPIPPTDELFSKELNGEAIRMVRCRRRKTDGQGVDPQYRLVAPALEGIKYNGRWVVIYSKYDLGCALERNTPSDCLGHDFDSAVRLGRAAVLYALRR